MGDSGRDEDFSILPGGNNLQREKTGGWLQCDKNQPKIQCSKDSESIKHQLNE